MNRHAFYQFLTGKIPPKKPLVMGILNITPDSFSDGGHFISAQNAYERAQEMMAQGADIIDIGGESTKPGAVPVSCEEELARVIPVIERLRAVSDICLSIDTYKATVMEAAISAGATFINDVKALTAPGALAIAAQLKVPVCLMHMQGTPGSMQDNPEYSGDIIDEINQFFKQRIDACLQAGIAREHIILDPGFGFGKTKAHNLTLVKRLHEFQTHERPILLGASRKQTIGLVLNKSPLERTIGGLAVSVMAALQGVSIIRTHDIDSTQQALTMTQAIQDA
jgi:dihydropteroate synthase